MAHGELDNIAGVVLTHKVMNEYIETGVLDFEKHLREPVIVHENAQVLDGDGTTTSSAVTNGNRTERIWLD